jgi:solute carrier family 25 protein 39/40
MMAVPAVGIYMPLYDMLMKPLEGLGPTAPLAAGALARMTAVLMTSPLELIRTRTQAVFTPQGLASTAPSGSATARTWSSVYLAAADLSALGRVQMLWRGVGATLARDVPFSAVYWGMLEPIRGALLPRDAATATPAQTISVNMLAGGIGGAAASAMTQPLDVVKTRMQLSEATGLRGGTLGTLRKVASEEGVRSLFAGVTPRALKAAPACAIVLASYECMKLLVARPHEQVS